MAYSAGAHPWITNFDTTTGEVTVNSANAALDMTDWTLRVIAANPESTDPAGSDSSDDIKVYLRDRCRAAVRTQDLDRINFNNEVIIWERNSLPFVGLTYDQTDCPIVYELREFLVNLNPVVTGFVYTFNQAD